MTKLIGTNPNQVPSNADLGTAAFMDKRDFLLSKGSSLSAIDAVIPKTAVDIFIYDTSKDSDGGAWRKRTQHTSWYNERLNTTTRGSRREFPAVAVIVATSSSVTIYDGDDPNLPMWMVFEINNSYWLKHTSSTIISVSMINATLVTGGTGSTGRASIINFISDNGHVSEALYNYVHRGISRRNIDPVGTAIGDIFIVNNSVSDVAMTVLPNAPIDSATGLPTPTIAVATDGGVSVIKDNGTVVDLYRSVAGTEYVHQVAFNKDNSLFFSWGTTNGQERHLSYYETIPSSDDIEITDNYYPSANMGSTAFGTNGTGIVANNGTDFAGSSDKTWLSRLMHTKESASNNTSSVAFITSSYNTGWMTGDIKLATLSDTDAADNSREYITNGTFDSDASGWSVTSGASITASSGVATVTSSGSSIWSGAYQGITGLEVGKTYIATADIITSSDWGSFSFSNGGGSAVKYGSYSSWNGGSTFPLKAVAYFVATTTSAVLAIDSLNTTAATVTQIDNITVREAEVDRSVNAKPLQVFGTVKKTPVASGADLVAYSGFSTSNYLQQPYNSSLHAGTGGYSVMVWAKTTELGHIACRGTADNDESMRIYLDDTNYGIYFDYGVGSPYCYLTNSADRSTALNGQWNHIVVHVSAGGPGRIYMNGKEMATTVAGNALSTFNNDTDYKLNIGVGYGGSSPFPGSISLFRYSLTIPSAEQIKKIYEDEKVLFQENAQATLYGSSDAVTALAYDDTTELLHVGTSNGRSVFQGLRRIDNTTDAVGAAISASNGMVAED